MKKTDDYFARFVGHCTSFIYRKYHVQHDCVVHSSFPNIFYIIDLTDSGLLGLDKDTRLFLWDKNMVNYDRWQKEHFYTVKSAIVGIKGKSCHVKYQIKAFTDTAIVLSIFMCPFFCDSFEWKRIYVVFLIACLYLHCHSRSNYQRVRVEIL